jgi:hypothetical protein
VIIVALDIATQTGVAVGSPGRAPKSWSVDLGKGRSEDARFSKALVLTHELIERFRPDLIAVEAAVGGKFASAFLIGTVACVRGVCANRGVPVRPYTSGSVRKHFLGRALAKRDFPALKPGAATRAIKGEVIARCRLLGWDVPDADAADAAALWDFACATAGHQTAPAGELFL